MLNDFNKSMLKDGMVVMLCDRDDPYSQGRHLYIADKFVSKKGSLPIVEYKDSLLYNNDRRRYPPYPEFDVMEVYEVKDVFCLDVDEWELNLIWKREEKFPTQTKIEEMESTISQLQNQIYELKKLEE